MCAYGLVWIDVSRYLQKTIQKTIVTKCVLTDWFELMFPDSSKKQLSNHGSHMVHMIPMVRHCSFDTYVSLWSWWFMVEKSHAKEVQEGQQIIEKPVKIIENRSWRPSGHPKKNEKWKCNKPMRKSLIWSQKCNKHMRKLHVQKWLFRCMLWKTSKTLWFFTTLGPPGRQETWKPG